ncbi:MAG: methyltransferase domain-containing protein [Candidatus Zixiibacteriota bacterium]|nr:MAG: methyltransferase domain-containing protein [candidate division Zixibacteria bacterium]
MLTLDKLPKKVLEKLDLQTVFMVSRVVVAAEKLQIFRKLHGKQLTAAQIGRMLGIHRQKREVFLGSLVAVGLLKKKGDLYFNSALAEKYFVRERSIYWTRLYSDQCITEYERFSVLEKMLATGKNYGSIVGKKNVGYLDVIAKNRTWACDFTHMLYYHHLPEARALAKKLNLRGYRSLLDVGGGSGVMSIALARKYPHLKACVLDMKTVTPVTRKIVRREGLSKQITTTVGDLNRDLPDGYDVMMFCDVDIADYRKTFKTAYDRLPAGGLIVVVEELASEDYTEPLLRMMWQLRTQGCLLRTRKEIADIVKACGFKSVKGSFLCRDSWMITGRKPT